MADEEEEKPSMSAECRVEALPLSGADISVEGLRLRLDIRIMPRSSDAASSADATRAESDAMFRVVTAKISKVSELPAYQWAAMMLGVGVLLVAVTLWISGPREAPSASEQRAPAGVAAATEAQGEARAAVAPAQPKTPAPAQAVAEQDSHPATPAALPSPSAPPSGVSLPAPPRVQREQSVAPPQRRETPKKAAPATRAVVAAAPSPPPASVAPEPVAQRPAARADMLDLFGDTK